MINDLSITSKVWKCVNDILIAEELSRNSISTIQSSLDAINPWSSLNWMKLNAKNCKEMRVCFFKEKPSLQPLQIDGIELEFVSSHKVLGLVIQSNLKWNEHIDLNYFQGFKTTSYFQSSTQGFTLNIIILPWHVLYWSIVVLCGITQFPST